MNTPGWAEFLDPRVALWSENRLPVRKSCLGAAGRCARRACSGAACRTARRGACRAALVAREGPLCAPAPAPWAEARCRPAAAHQAHAVAGDRARAPMPCPRHAQPPTPQAPRELARLRSLPLPAPGKQPELHVAGRANARARPPGRRSERADDAPQKGARQSKRRTPAAAHASHAGAPVGAPHTRSRSRACITCRRR